MKAVLTLVIILVAVLSLGCVGPKQQSVSTGPAVTETPGSTDMEQGSDDFGFEKDLADMDSMFNDSSMNISLDVGDTFT